MMTLTDNSEIIEEMTPKEYIQQLANSLRKAVAKQSGEDIPEGIRYIKMSVTLASEIANNLEKIDLS